MKKGAIIVATIATLGIATLIVLQPKPRKEPPPWLSSVFRGQTKAELIDLLGRHGKHFVIRSDGTSGQELVDIDPPNDLSLFIPQRTYGIELIGGKVTQAWQTDVHLLDDNDAGIPLTDRKPHQNR